MNGFSSKRCFIGILFAILVLGAVMPCQAAAPDPTKSWFEPQAGTVKNPLKGAAAVQFFRACPNNDGGASLPNNARIKIQLLDASGLPPVPAVPASDVYILFNGGTLAQGFSGTGTDSIIANGTWNTTPLCPTVTKITADAPTDVNGVTYITFTGASGTPGVGLRDPNRKWGHYDQQIPVFVDIGGVPNALTSPFLYKGNPYRLRIKNFDHSGGLGAVLNQGETVTAIDFNGMVVTMFASNAVSYWRDFDDDGYVALPDFDMLYVHLNHDCDTPLNP